MIRINIIHHNKILPSSSDRYHRHQTAIIVTEDAIIVTEDAIIVTGIAIIVNRGDVVAIANI